MKSESTPPSLPRPDVARSVELPAVKQPEWQTALRPHMAASLAPRRRRNIILVTITTLAVLVLVAVVSALAWYTWALKAPSTDGAQVRFVVARGETATTIAKDLQEHGLIRSQSAFNIYTHMTKTRGKLQAGGYVLSPKQDVATIVEHMVSGKTDEFNVTISPGLTLDELRVQFRANGFSDDEITKAFSAPYNHPLLADKPASASLEGYIYPETYRVSADQTLEMLLERSFDELYDTLNEKGYVQEFSKRGLSVYQALTLASIVQKEVMNPIDQKQVAQVFYQRLNDGMQLGSDVTYMYAAEQMGVEGTPGLESPYNTRKYTGLPPGPIANMNPSALDAVAFPAAGDYLYFVAGDGADEGKTFFARTEQEHEANIAAHCHVLCR